MISRFPQCALILSIFFLFGCGRGIVPNKSFDQYPIPAAPNYSLESSWSALPEMKDSADVVPDGLSDNQAEARVDVFYIHPTTYKGKTWNASLNDEKTNFKTDSKPTKFQASIFNGSCKVYAPRYRQATLQSFYKKPGDAQFALDLAYQDVLSAFRYYLEHYNNGRPFVLATHSQGTSHGLRLIKEEIDGTKIQDQMVVAYLVGFAVPKESFEHIPLCQNASETGCYASWATYRDGYLPKRYASFFVNNSVVNPVSWNTTSEMVPRENHLGSSLNKKMAIESNLFDTRIMHNILWITKPDIKGKFFITFRNYHVADYNLFYQDIRENVALRIETYFNGNETD